MKKEDEIIKNEDSLIEASVWGAAEELTSDDFLISRISVTQPLSKIVLEGEASVGELRDSVTKELLAKQGEVYEVIIFYRILNWVILKNGNYLKTEPVTVENTNLLSEEFVNGEKIERIKTFNFYCLPIKDGIAAQPKVLVMKKASIMKAKELQMFFGKLASLKKPSASVVIELFPIKQIRKEHTFFACNFKIGRETTKDELGLAYRWYQSMKNVKNVIVDKIEEDEDVSHPVSNVVDDDSIPF